MFARLGELANRRKKRTLVLAFAFVAVAGVLGSPVAGKLTSASNNFEDPSSPSIKVRKALERAQGANPNVALIALVRSPSETRAERVAAEIGTDPVVARVFGYFNTHNSAFFSRDR